MAKAQNDATAIVTKAHDALASERRRAEIELSDSVIDLSVEIAARLSVTISARASSASSLTHYLAEVDGPDDKASVNARRRPKHTLVRSSRLRVLKIAQT